MSPPPYLYLLCFPKGVPVSRFVPGDLQRAGERFALSRFYPCQRAYFGEQKAGGAAPGSEGGGGDQPAASLCADFGGRGAASRGIDRREQGEVPQALMHSRFWHKQSGLRFGRFGSGNFGRLGDVRLGDVRLGAKRDVAGGLYLPPAPLMLGLHVMMVIGGRLCLRRSVLSVYIFGEAARKRRSCLKEWFVYGMDAANTVLMV